MLNLRSRIHELEAKIEKSKELAVYTGGSYQEWLVHNFPDMIWDAPHLVYAQKYIDKIIDGSIKRLMIFWPPRHGKSELVTVRLPLYYFCRNPKSRVIMGAYNQEFASGFSYETRALAAGLLNISKDSKSLNQWRLEEGGYYRCAGVRSGVTGKGADIIILDDPVKNREDADSEVFRDKVYREYTNSFYSRLEPNAAIIIILTRWHEDDLAGRILNSEMGGEWEVINLPALAEDNDPLHREIDEPLWPERFNYKTLIDIKKTLGRDFQALYQQRPSSEEGEIIPVKELQDYSVAPAFTHIIQSWDTAFKTGEENDYSVGTTWGVARDGYYLLDRIKDRMQMPELKQAIMQQAYKWDPNVVLIEDAASGQSAIQELQGLSRVPVLAVKADSSKISRAHASSDAVASHRVFLPAFTPWKEDFIHQLSVFPNGKNDDDVDSFTMAINYLTKRFANSFAVYPEYNDNIHVAHDPKYQPVFIDFCVGIFVDSMVSAVLIGVTEKSSLVVMKEFSWKGSLDNFLDDVFLVYLKKVLNETKPKFFVRSERKDSYWWEILRDHNIDFEDLSAVKEQEMMDSVKELLSVLIGGEGGLVVFPKTCPDIREGFMGAYCYKARSESSSIEYQEKPVKNKYLRLHVALQVALYEHRNYTDYSHELVSGSDLNMADDDRSVVSGY